MSILARRLLAIDHGLNRAEISHAFGGAIALAYCTFEPRATQDLDINIFLPSKEAPRALAALPTEVTITAQNRGQITKIAQTRLWWDDTPIDVFFNNVEFHDTAAARTRTVPFAGSTIPILDCTCLAVFKAFFNQTKDWADLEAMNAAGQLDIGAVRAFLIEFLEKDDPRLDRLAALAE